MANDNTINSELIRGHIDTIILRSLYDGDKHGNEICLDIEDKSDGQYELKQPTLYSALKRLENSGYVTAYWQSGVGGRRRYFKLTDSGKKLCDDNFSNWIHSRNVIDKLLTDGGDLGYVFEEPKVKKIAFDAEEYKNYTFTPIEDDEEDFIPTSSFADSITTPSAFGQQIIKHVDDTDEETRKQAESNEYNLNTLSKNDEITQLTLINDEPEETTEEEPDADEEIIITVSEPVQTLVQQEKTETIEEQSVKKTEEPDKNVFYSDEDDDTLDLSRYSLDKNYAEEDTYKDILEKLFPNENSTDSTKKETDDSKNFYDEEDDEEDDERITPKYDYSEDVTPSAVTVNQEERKQKPKKEDRNATGIDYSDILALAHMQGFKVRTADRTNFIPQGKLFISKLRALSATILFVIMLAEAAALCFPLQDVIGITLPQMLYVVAGLAIFPVITYIALAFTPNKTVDTITDMKYAVTAAFVAVLNLLLLTLAIALIAKIDFNNVKQVLVYLVFPFIVYLNVPIYFFIKYLLLSYGVCLTKES